MNTVVLKGVKNYQKSADVILLDGPSAKLLNLRLNLLPYFDIIERRLVSKQYWTFEFKVLTF